MRSTPPSARATSPARVRSACSRSIPTTVAGIGEGGHDRTADPASGARDHRDLSRERAHPAGFNLLARSVGAVTRVGR